MTSEIFLSKMQEIPAGLAEADRGDFAGAAEGRAVFDRYTRPRDRAPRPPPHLPPVSQGSKGATAGAGAGASTGTPNIGARAAARCR